MKSPALLLTVLLLILSESAFAQTTATEGQVAIGGVGGPGTAGLLVAARVSLHASPRVSLDIDAGFVSASSDRARGAASAQLRWRRTTRRTDGSSDYGIFGLMHARETRRTEIRFPNETVIRTERVSGITPVVGYGFDWVHRSGTRVGVELTGGGSESAGPRLFAKVFTVWAPRR